MKFDRNKPYNALPLLPPKGVELDSRVVLTKTISASRALAELKGAGDAIPNQTILINSIVLQEARVSSEIENIVTTNDELYQAASDNLAGASPNTKEVLHYREALWHGFQQLKKRPLSTNLFIETVEIIKQKPMGIRRVPGTKLATPAGDVIYTPPEGEALLREKLTNLERFIHDPDNLDPLVRLAVMHYQFEAIHPFTDGNGRTGRLINILYLVEKGLLDLPVLYLSHEIIRKKNDYYQGLRRVTEAGAWEDWIIYFLNVVERTAKQTRERIFRIQDLMEEISKEAHARVGKAYSKDLIEIIFQNPYCRIDFLVQAGLAKRQTASTYLKTFEQAGLLRGVKRGRESYYINDRLLKVLAEK